MRLISAGSQVRVLSGPDSRDKRFSMEGKTPKSLNQNCSDPRDQKSSLTSAYRVEKYNFKNKNEAESEMLQAERGTYRQVASNKNFSYQGKKSYKEHMMDALVPEGDEGRAKLR